MPLLIDLKPNERIIINGAVIENAGASTKLRVHNESNILRQKEIMTQEAVNSPASMVYFCVQCAYIFPDKREQYLPKLFEFLSEYLKAAPSAQEIGDAIAADVAADQFYRALKSARKLLKHEADVVSYYVKNNEAE